MSEQTQNPTSQGEQIGGPSQASCPTGSGPCPQWCDQARMIVAYPEDFGMSRRDVQGLQRLLAAVERPSSASLTERSVSNAA